MSLFYECRLCYRKKDGCNSASGLSVNWAAVLLLALATGQLANHSGLFRLGLIYILLLLIIFFRAGHTTIV